MCIRTYRIRTQVEREIVNTSSSSHTIVLHYNGNRSKVTIDIGLYTTVHETASRFFCYIARSFIVKTEMNRCWIRASPCSCVLLTAPRYRTKKEHTDQSVLSPPTVRIDGQTVSIRGDQL